MITPAIERAATEAIKLALRPLVRISLRHSIKLMDLFELLKVVFVAVTQEELERASEDMSVSKISVMSGVHRRDVTRIIKDKGAVRKPENIISKVIGQWQHDPKFKTGSGKPKTLTSAGIGSDFFALVQSVSSDLAPYTVLFELERLGLVTTTARGVKLKQKFQLAKAGDFADGYEMFGEDMRDLGEAIDQNLRDPQEISNLHLKTEFSAIPRTAVPAIKKWLLKNGSEFHSRVEQYLARFDGDILIPKKQQETVRVAYGSFCITE